MADDKMRLFCIVDVDDEDEDEVFFVDVSPTSDIATLKELIFTKCFLNMSQALPKRLILWKVSTWSKSTSMAKLTALGSSSNQYTSPPPNPWSIAYEAKEALNSRNFPRN